MPENKQPFYRFRKDAGLTIEGAAKAFNVDRATIIRWEKGTTMIPLKRMDDAKAIINASARELRPDIFEAA